MKNLLLIVILSVSTTITTAQNFVGETLVTIVTEMNKKGYTVTKDYTDDGTRFITYENEDEVFFAHYFNENNVCVASSVYFPKGSKRTVITTALSNNGYTEDNYTQWSNSWFLVSIKWNININQYVLTFKYKF